MHLRIDVQRSPITGRSLASGRSLAKSEGPTSGRSPTSLVAEENSGFTWAEFRRHEGILL
ncbi:hypothetical protein KFK09_013333 [Dendrobium nobile]|uniref:Uncharacterized protein n=1 Tax=Dendrobium nobile TaxID=94219 RepID=A0A8T3B8N1_DENNO|nr:hypothetical protein KFK09_013333 [Dendrobium nobile]